MSQENDKRELLKLKQGLIDSSSAIDESGYAVNMPQTAGEKAKNWAWYHIGIIAAVIIIAALCVVIYFAFFQSKKADITIYSINNYTGTMCNLLESGFENYCPDFDDNSDITVDINKSVNDEVLGNIDLYEEIDNGSSQVFIGTREQLTAVYDDIMAADGKELFADLSEIDGADGYLIDLRQTSFGKKMQIFSTEIFAAVRKTDDESQSNAMEFLNNLSVGVIYKQ